MTDKLARADSAYSLAREAGDETIVVGLDFALALVNIAKAAQVVMQEVEADLPIKCLICAWPNDEHVDGCPVPDLRAALAVLDGDQ